MVTVNAMSFYPYPKSLEEKLSELKTLNAEKTEKYLRLKEKERNYFLLIEVSFTFFLNLIKNFHTRQNDSVGQNEATEVKNLTRKIEKPEKSVEEGGIDIMDQKPGMIVWAKMQGYSLWPCNN